MSVSGDKDKNLFMLTKHKSSWRSQMILMMLGLLAPKLGEKNEEQSNIVLLGYLPSKRTNLLIDESWLQPDSRSSFHLRWKQLSDLCLSHWWCPCSCQKYWASNLWIACKPWPRSQKFGLISGLFICMVLFETILASVWDLACYYLVMSKLGNIAATVCESVFETWNQLL